MTFIFISFIYSGIYPGIYLFICLLYSCLLNDKFVNYCLSMQYEKYHWPWTDWTRITSPLTSDIFFYHLVDMNTLILLVHNHVIYNCITGLPSKYNN